jgi:ubiquinone/menaquinone biosynthesis C-methylase UbiE
LNAFEELFSDIDGGRVLDVATGEGGYIPVLRSYLGSFTHITGLDMKQLLLRKAQKKLDIERIEFTQMNAEHLGFETKTLDTVNIAASLHHLENVRRVLAEMKRVLKPGGKFILTEMHRDGGTEEQFTAIRIHHWAAAVDTSLGILHDRTFARQEIIDFVDELNLVNIEIRDFSGKMINPRDASAMAGISEYLDRYHQRLVSKSSNEMLLQQELELRASLTSKGFQREPLLVIIAERA